MNLDTKIKYILLNDWDPIGISHMEETSTEYDEYAKAICSILEKNDSYHLIYKYLMWLSLEYIGLSESSIDKNHTINIAKKIFKLKSHS